MNVQNYTSFVRETWRNTQEILKMLNFPFCFYGFKITATVRTHNQEKRTGTYLRKDDFSI